MKIRILALALVLTLGLAVSAWPQSAYRSDQPQAYPGSGSSSGGPPTGAAGGDLGGTYPNPTVTNGSHITNASISNSGLMLVGPAVGGTGANLSATGGASQVLQQTTSGGAVSVGQLACANLSDGGNGGCAATISGPTGWTLTDQSGASLVFTGVAVTSDRIGNIIHVEGSFTFPSTVSGANVSIGTLPATVVNNYGGGLLQIAAQGATLTAPIIGAFGQNTTTFFMRNASAFNTSIINSVLSTFTIDFSGWYPLS